MRKYISIIVIIAAVAALCASCSGKKKVVMGTQYKCKECGEIYRDDTREIEVRREVADDVNVEVVEDYCPTCGDEVVVVEQIQYQICPVCEADRGAVTREIKIERKLADTLQREVEAPVPCPTGRCRRVSRLHEKYNWDWEFCKAVSSQEIGLGFNEDMVREAWGPPKRVEKMGNAKRWYYDAGYVTFGASGKAVEIK
ncbi:MAG: hypothetical protein GTN49_07815 [candidate division Zixibacteria bacterium]|nr:hypothetical protein [candidate division Zixibacteria bacterium]